MKISIKFDSSDDSVLQKVTMLGGCGELDEFACTFLSIVSATNWDFDAVVASTLKYTSKDYSPILEKACRVWLENHEKYSTVVENNE